MKWVSSFCDRAASATRHVTQQIKLHDHVRRLDTLHAVTHALVREPQRPDLLRAVAGYTRNLLAADVVVIYGYLSSDKRFPSKPTVVGRLIAPRKALIPKSGDFLPLRLAKHDEDVYAPEPSSHPVLNGSKFSGFIAREGIESVAAVRLCEGEDVVGVMFINYRTRQRFSERTRTIVRVLADTAALAIKTGGTYRRFMFDLSRRTREMAALLSVDREIVRGHQDKARPDTARVFKLILEKALELTGADAGYIMGFDGIKTLDLKAGIGLPDDQSHLSHELGWGIVGLAAHERKSIRVPDVTLEPWKQYYLSVIPDTRSELAVPLRAHDGLIGVINLESKEKDHFSEDDKRLVDTLAAQAVISVHSVAVYLQLDRQIAPLKSLVHSVSRVQAAGTNLDRLLRVLLTSVTAEQGLGFSRAMILLHDPSREALRGEIAIGAISQEEADSVWGNLRGMVSSSNPKSGFFDHLLDQAEALSEDVVDDPDRDSALSRAVKRLDLPLHSPGVICTCFRDASMPILVEERKSDPFRQKLRELIGDGLTDKAEATYAFVVMPLVGHDACFGVLVVDNRYRYPVVGIESDDMDRLEIFGRFIALSIEGMRIQRERERRKDQEREKNVRAVVEKNVFHTVNSQVAVFEVYKEHIEEMLFNHRQSIPETLYQELSEIVTSIGTGIHTLRKDLRQERQKITSTDFVSVRLRQVLDQAINTHCDRIREMGVEIKEKSDDWLDLLCVSGQPSHLSRAFGHLIDNALDALKASNLDERWIEVKITVEEQTHLQHPCVQIEIANPGPEIPACSKLAILKSGITSKPGAGRGHGLAIVRDTFELHNGSISEIGSTGEVRFLVCLPLINQ